MMVHTMAAILLGLIAGSPTLSAAVDPVSVHSRKEREGMRLYSQSCSVCHELARMNRSTFGFVFHRYGARLSADTLGGDEDVLREVIENGSPKMPGFKYSLRRGEIDAIIAYIKTLPAPTAPKPLLYGRIESAAGESMGGVTVSAKPEGGTITTSVFSDEDGHYYFPGLPSGRYRVWAQALGYEKAEQRIQLLKNRSLDLALAPLSDPERRFKQLSGTLMLSSLPENDPADRKMKRLIQNDCTACHTASFALQNRFDQAGWHAVIEYMKKVDVHGDFREGARKPYGILDYNQEELSEYLAKARGPEATPKKIKLSPRPSGEAARAVFQEYEFPLEAAAGLPADYIQNDGSDWTMGTPLAGFPGWGLHDSFLDLSGNLWFTNPFGSKQTTIGRVDAITGETKLFKIHTADDTAAWSHGMTRDATGIIWFNVNPGRGSLARLDPKTEEIKIFTPPPEMSAVGGAGISLDYDGKGGIWVSAEHGALRFDPQTEKFTEFKSLTPSSTSYNGLTYGVAGDRDGNGFWAEFALDIIGVGIPRKNRSLEIRLPPVKETLDLFSAKDRQFYSSKYVADHFTPLPWAQGPRRMATDKQANVLWVADSWGGNLARIDTHSLKTTFLQAPDGHQPYAVAVDSRHNVWTNLWNSDGVLRYNPKSSTWTMFELPTRGAESRHISLLERKGQPLQVAITYFRGRKIAVMTLRSESDLRELRKEVEPRGKKRKRKQE